MLDTVKPVAKRYEYERMTGEQLSAALDQIGIDAATFSELHGAKQERVENWQAGRDAPPQSAALLCVLLTIPGALDLALQTRGRWTAARFSSALAQLGITMREFGKLTGTKPERVKAWLDGDDNIPQSAALAAVLLTLPGALDLARTFSHFVFSDTRSPSTSHIQ